jgi:hypothetical protein
MGAAEATVAVAAEEGAVAVEPAVEDCSVTAKLATAIDEAATLAASKKPQAAETAHALAASAIAEETGGSGSRTGSGSVGS